MKSTANCLFSAEYPCAATGSAGLAQTGDGWSNAGFGTRFRERQAGVSFEAYEWHVSYGEHPRRGNCASPAIIGAGHKMPGQPKESLGSVIPLSGSACIAGRRMWGFTLLELLAVVTIVILLAAFVVPAVNSILNGLSLTQGGQMYRDQLSFARQTALAQNCQVEVRYYQYSDPSVPGETAGNPNLGKFFAMQLFKILQSGSAVALDKIQRLPSGIIMDSGTTMSSLVGSQSIISGTSLGESIPVEGTNYNSVSFRFLPDGSTTLSPVGIWFLSLHYLTAGDNLGSTGGSNIPKDFITLQIEPVNGKATFYRPGI